MEKFEVNTMEGAITSELEKRELLKQTTAYINAGGRGTRLEPILPKDDKIGISKSLIRFGEKDPIIKYHVERLRKKGFGNILVNAGDHLNVKESLKNEENESMKVVNCEIQKGTGGDLIRAIREMPDVGKYVLIHNSDTLIDIDEGSMLKQHKDSGAVATFAMTRRTDVPNEGAFCIGRDGKILFNREVIPEYTTSEPDENDIAYRASSVGVVVFNVEAIKNYSWQPSEGSLSIYTQMIGKLIQEGKVFAYDNGKNFFIDIGTPKNYEKVRRHPMLKKILEAR